MTLDPSLGYVAPSGPTGGGGGAGGTYDPTNPAPGQYIDANGGRFYLLGENPTTGAPMWSSFVASKSGTVTVGGRLIDADTGQVIYEPPQSGAGGGLSPNTVYGEQHADARDAANIAEQQRQFNETLWMNKARGDQQQQLSGELGRGNLAVSQGRLGLDTQQQAIDWYNAQAQRYSNPRNFIESLFYQRGQPAPQGAASLAIGRPLGQFYGTPTQQPTTSLATTPMRENVQPPVPQTASPYNPNTDPNRGTMYEGLSGFNTDGTLRLAPNDPDKETLMAKYPGRYKVGYASGGVVPEPVIGVGTRSGQMYSFGENGPEGVVPAEYLPDFLKQRGGSVQSPDAQDRNRTQTRDPMWGPYSGLLDYIFNPQMHPQKRGYANGGIIGFDEGTGGYGDPYEPTPPTYTDPYSTPQDPSNPYSGAFDPYANVTTQTYGPQVPTGYGPTNPQLPDYTQTPAPFGFHWQGGALVQDAPLTPDKPYIAPPQYQQPITQTTVGGGGTGGGGITTGGGGITTGGSTVTGPLDTNMPPPGTVWDPITKTYVKVQGEAPPVSTPGPFIQQPTGVPQGDGTFSNAPTAGALMPRDIAAAGTFGNISGNRPTFLPGEDQGSPLSALLNANALPPFLSRLFAQQQGIQSQGTNQPQRLALPPDLPLVSKLAWTQMQPSEQQALLSYASAYGVTPEDYLAAIESFSPQGGNAQSPLFGNSVRFNYQ